MKVMDQHMEHRAKSRRAFTLIELLVVISIIAILVALLMPALRRTRRQANVTECSVHLKQYALGLTLYATEDLQGVYPPHTLGDGVPPYGIWWTAGGFFASNFGNDRTSYLTTYRDMICGGNMRILWCPLYYYYYSPLLPELYGGEIDPQFPLLWYDSRFGNPRYMTGYDRFANIRSGTNWANSGNTRTDGPPEGPGSAQDAILSDTDVCIAPLSEYYSNHSRPWWTSNFNQAQLMRRENNVAYSDGHVETHGGRLFVAGDGYLTWSGANYIPRLGIERHNY